MQPKEFKYKQFESKVILLCVRWYLKYPLSFRNLKDIMMERGIEVSHTSIMRWTHQYASILENKVRRQLNGNIYIERWTLKVIL
jgi:transposase-like protein